MESSSAAASPESKADCPICLGPLTDPYRLSICRHEFCRVCLHQALKVSCHCPKCRGRVETHDISNIDVDGASSNAPIRRAQRLGFPLIGLTGPPDPAQRNNLSIPSLARLFSTSRSNQTPASISNPRNLGASLANSSTPAPTHPGPAPTPFPRSASTLRRIVTPPPHPSGAVSAPDQAPATLTPVPSVPAPLPTTAPPFLSFSSSSSLSSDDDSDSLSELEDILEDLQFNQSNRPSQPPSPAVSLFPCPYCQEGGLDELGLRDHCNQNHPQDRTSVVCPICVCLPHGNPTQVSRNFIAHLNLRHCYHINDYTNVSHSDSMNEQDAIFESYRVNKQNAG